MWRLKRPALCQSTRHWDNGAAILLQATLGAFQAIGTAVGGVGGTSSIMALGATQPGFGQLQEPLDTQKWSLRDVKWRQVFARRDPAAPPASAAAVVR